MFFVREKRKTIYRLLWVCSDILWAISHIYIIVLSRSPSASFMCTHYTLVVHFWVLFMFCFCRWNFWTIFVQLNYLIELSTKYPYVMISNINVMYLNIYALVVQFHRHCPCLVRSVYLCTRFSMLSKYLTWRYSMETGNFWATTG